MAAIEVPMGYKLAFMPSDSEILLIGKEVIGNDKSIYRDKAVNVDMYNISFIEKLAKALPAIDIKNTYLVITGRKPNPESNGFMRDVGGYEGAYWHEGGEPVKIDELGYFRDMSLILGGEGDEGGGNDVWFMREYFTSSVIESGQVICTVYLADSSVKKALKELYAGLAVAEVFKERATAAREITVPSTGGDRGKSVGRKGNGIWISERSESRGITVETETPVNAGDKGKGVLTEEKGNGVWISERSESRGITVESETRVNAGDKGKSVLIEEKGKRVGSRERIRKDQRESTERVGSSNDAVQTQELDFVDSVLGSVYCKICHPVVEGAGEGVHLTSAEKNDMTTTQYYNQDEEELLPRKNDMTTTEFYNQDEQELLHHD